MMDKHWQQPSASDLPMSEKNFGRGSIGSSYRKRGLPVFPISNTLPKVRVEDACSDPAKCSVNEDVIEELPVFWTRKTTNRKTTR